MRPTVPTHPVCTSAVHPPRNRIDEDKKRSCRRRGTVRGTPRGCPSDTPGRCHQEDRPMGAYYVGLDLHSQFTTFVIQEAGTIVARGMVPTTPEAFARLAQAHHL